MVAAGNGPGHGKMLRDLGMGALYAVGIVVVLIALLAAAALWYSLLVPGRSHSGPIPPATPEETALGDRLKGHVVAIASEPHNVRYYEALEAAAVHSEKTLAG